jgi:hypothetical protein
MPGGKWSLDDMSRFTLTELHKHIETDLAIIVHWDGYAINKAKWDERFLQYDYIGGPWPRHMAFVKRYPRNRVGNGGFSLRSKKWLQTAATLPRIPDGVSEDVYTCTTHAAHFARAGCKTAPVDLAMKWSFEHRCEEWPRWRLADSYGFHGLTEIDPMRKSLRLDPNS